MTNNQVVPLHKVVMILLVLVIGMMQRHQIVWVINVHITLSKLLNGNELLHFHHFLGKHQNISLRRREICPSNLVITEKTVARCHLVISLKDSHVPCWCWHPLCHQANKSAAPFQESSLSWISLEIPTHQHKPPNRFISRHEIILYVTIPHRYRLY